MQTKRLQKYPGFPFIFVIYERIWQSTPGCASAPKIVKKISLPQAIPLAKRDYLAYVFALYSYFKTGRTFYIVSHMEPSRSMLTIQKME